MQEERSAIKVRRNTKAIITLPATYREAVHYVRHPDV